MDGSVSSLDIFLLFLYRRHVNRDLSINLSRLFVNYNVPLWKQSSLLTCFLLTERPFFVVGALLTGFSYTSELSLTSELAELE